MKPDIKKPEQREIFDIYSYRANHLIAAGGFITQDAYLRRNGKNINLRSITFNVDLRDNVTGEFIKYDNSLLQRMSLLVGDPTLLQPITRTFEDITLPGTIQALGQHIMLYKPGQWFFNSFIIRNEILFRLIWQNGDIADGMNVDFNLIVEISILDW
jgi:hypothetical protein